MKYEILQDLMHHVYIFEDYHNSQAVDTFYIYQMSRLIEPVGFWKYLELYRLIPLALKKGTYNWKFGTDIYHSFFFLFSFHYTLLLSP